MCFYTNEQGKDDFIKESLSYITEKSWETVVGLCGHSLSYSEYLILPELVQTECGFTKSLLKYFRPSCDLMFSL